MIPGMVMRTGYTGGGSSFSADADVNAYLNALSPSPSSSRQSLISNLIAGLKQDGLWSKFRFLFLFAQENQQGGTINMVAPKASGITTAYTSFSADKGWAGVQTTGTPLGRYTYTQNNAQYSWWKTVYTDNGTYGYHVGTEGETPNFSYFDYGQTSSEFDVNSNYINGNFPSTTGMQCVVSSSSITYYYNGASCYSTSGYGQSTSFTKDISAFYCNQYAQYNNYTNRSTLGFLSMSDAMGSSDQSAFYNRMKIYMNAIGVS